jgi:hypothetical protein
VDSFLDEYGEDDSSILDDEIDDSEFDPTKDYENEND